MGGWIPVSGDDISPKLRLLRPLGRGGMSVVWLAEDRALGCEVVVKFLRNESADDPSAAKRIAREAAAAARVRSLHTVRTFDCGVTPTGMPFIVMELLEGRDLGRHLETKGPLSAAETASILGQLANGLEKTHAAGLVHRDVKPSNIFLCFEGGTVLVKLLDFGLAQRFADDSSTTGSRPCAGTPRYMSPEQIVGAALDGRSDIWSLAVVAFQCLTGRRPFEGETFGAVALAIHTLPLPRLTDLRPDLPAAVDTWFAKASARAPGDRFGSALDAVNAMACALGIESHSGYPNGEASFLREDATMTSDFAPVRTPRAPAERSSTDAWMISAAAGVTVLMGGAYLSSFRSPETRVRDVDTRTSTVESTAPRVALAGEVSPEWAVAIDKPGPAPVVIQPGGSNGAFVRSALLQRRTASPTPSISIDASPRPGAHLYELPDERH